jgi:hypothetical protein
MLGIKACAKNHCDTPPFLNAVPSRRRTASLAGPVSRQRVAQESCRCILTRHHIRVFVTFRSRIASEVRSPRMRQTRRRSRSTFDLCKLRRAPGTITSDPTQKARSPVFLDVTVAANTDGACTISRRFPTRKNVNEDGAAGKDQMVNAAWALRSNLTNDARAPAI